MFDLEEVFKNNFRIFDLDSEQEISLPNMDEVLKAYKEVNKSYYRSLGQTLGEPSPFLNEDNFPKMPRMPVLPSVVLATSGPLPGDYISIEDAVYKVEQRYFHLSADNSWVEIWVRAQNKQ